MPRDVMAESGPSYEMVLEAVQESRRGRWFLEEFKARHSHQNSRQILGAIARLESRIEAMPAAQGDTAELRRMREAIAATRQDILKAAGATQLSEEGRLFAHLADLARQAAPQISGATGGTGIPDGIVQALKLVDQIDRSLNRGNPAAEKCFERDSDLFEAPPAPAKPVVTAVETPPAAAEDAAPEKPAPSKPVVEAPLLGARLVISRTKSASAVQAPPPSPASPSASPPESPPESPPAGMRVSAAPKAELPETVDGHPRIVIIRRKPEDMPALAAELQPAAENAA